MDWINSIQNAINYIEDNLKNDIDYNELAKIAYCSPFHFQRIFSIVCGYSVGEYIRKRRLTLAGEDLLRSDEKIIDIAFKYRYESSESFTRAFAKFHGFNPSEVRKGANIKSFSRLSVKIIISGGSIMEYRIEKLDAFKIACKKKRVNKPENASATDINDFWKECTEDGSIEKIVSLYDDNSKLKGLLGVSFSESLHDLKFPYAIGVEYNKELLDKDLELVTIPANTYAVFTCKGKMPEAFKKTFYQIVTEFFPQNPKYEYASSIEMEVYPSRKIEDDDYVCEIWIGINEK